MAARSIWNGAVTFGMVSIPVRLSPATSSKDLAFNELHTVCKKRLKRQRWCPVCNKDVPADEVLKGYEYSKDQYVEMTEGDFEKVPLTSKHTIEISRFVEASEIDSVYYDSHYVLEPNEMGARPFSLFMHAMVTKGMVAIGHITIRKKEQLCALRAMGGNLILETLYYADELRVDGEKSLPDVQLSDAESKMAEALVDLLRAPFDANEYKDAYREALSEVIQAKLDGKEIISAPEAPAQVMDLVEALRASVEAAQKRRVG